IAQRNEKIATIKETIDHIYSSPSYRKEELELVDLNENGRPDDDDRQMYASLVESYCLMDLNALERNTLNILEDDTQTVIYGKSYDAVYSTQAGEFTLASGAYTVQVAEGDHIVFDGVQISYAATYTTVTDGGESKAKLILTRDKVFTAAVKPVPEASSAMTIHGVEYQVQSVFDGNYAGEDRYKYTFSAGEKTYESTLKGLLTKVGFDGLTFDINDAGSGFILTEENVTDTGVYLTTESTSSILAQLYLEVKADVASPAGVFEPDGKLDIEDVKRLKIDMMDVTGDGIKDNRDLDLVWTIIDYNQDLLTKYDYDPNDKLDEGDIDAFRYLIEAGGTGLNLDLDNDGETDEFDTEYLRQIVTAELVKSHLRSRIDKDHDGKIIAEERTLLERLRNLAKTDLDQNGIINEDDLTIFDQLKLFTDDIISEFGEEVVTAADINGDHIVNYKDAGLLKDAKQFHVDVDGNGEVGQWDGYILDAIINPSTSGVTYFPGWDTIGTKVVDLPQYTLTESVLGKTDFDENGIINSDDFDGWSLFDMNTIRNVVNAGETAVGLQGFWSEEGILISSTGDAGSFSYNVTPQSAGTYRAAIKANSSAFTILYFNVYVDGELYGDFSLGTSSSMDSEGYIELDLASGGEEHLITFEMTNASSRQMSVKIKEFILTEPVPSNYDIDGDNMYTPQDGRVIQRMITSQKFINECDINADRIVSVDDLALLDINGNGLIDDDEGASSAAAFDVDGDGNISQMEARRDLDGNGKVEQSDLDMLRYMLDSINFISKSDVNADGFIDVKDLNALRGSLDVLNSPARLALEEETVWLVSDKFHTVSRSEIARSDIDGNGIVDSRDISFARRFILEDGGLINTIRDFDMPLLASEGVQIKIGDAVYGSIDISSMLARLADLEVVGGKLHKPLVETEGFDAPSLPDWQGLSGEWFVSGSRCSGAATDSSAALILYENTPQEKDFLLEAQVRLAGDGDDTGLVFRTQDEKNYFEIVLNPKLNRLEFRKVVEGAKSAVIAYMNLTGGISADTWYSIKVIAKGDRYTFYLDGAKTFEAQSAQFKLGKAGFVATGSVPSDFDNFMLGANATFKEVVKKSALVNDLNGDGTLDVWDYATLDALSSLEETLSDETIQAMARISRGDVTGDGKVDAEDKSYFDIDGSGAIDADDINIIEETLRMSTEYLKHDTVDIDQNGTVTSKDASALDSVLGHMIDLNEDGKFNQRDVDLFEFIEWNIDLNYSYLERVNADVNGDGFVDAKDIEAFDLSMQYWDKVKDLNENDLLDVITASGNPYSDSNSMVTPDYFAKADVTGDGRVNESDYGEISDMWNFIQTAQDQELAYAMMDVYKYDIDGNTMFTENDVSLLGYIKQRVAEGKVLTAQEFLGYDLNSDNVINYSDHIQFTKVHAYHVDVDGSGMVNYEVDRKFLHQTLYRMSLGITKEMIEKCNLDGDMSIDYSDRALLDDAMQVKERIDLDGDGELSASEIQTVRTLISGFSKGEIVNKNVVKGADINGDGEVNSLDISALEKEIDSLRAEALSAERTIKNAPVLAERMRTEAIDVNGDGKRDATDIEFITGLIEYQQYKVDEDITDELIRRADINQDGRVNAEDMVFMDMHFGESLREFDFTGDSRITADDFQEFEDTRFAISNGDIPNLRQVDKFDLDQDGGIGKEDIDKVTYAYLGRVDIDGDLVIDDAEWEEGGPADGLTDREVLTDLVSMQELVMSMNALTDASDPLSVIQSLLDEDLAKNQEAWLNRFEKAAGIDGSGDGRISEADTDKFLYGLQTRDNPYYDIDYSGTFNAQDVFLIEELQLHLNQYGTLERQSILEDKPVVYSRTILQASEFDIRDITNDLVIDEEDLIAIQEARERTMSFSADNLVREKDVELNYVFREMNMSITLEDMYRANFVTVNDKDPDNLENEIVTLGKMLEGKGAEADDNNETASPFGDEMQSAGEFVENYRAAASGEWSYPGSFVERTLNLPFGPANGLRPRIEGDLYSHVEEKTGPPPAEPVQPGFENIFDGRGYGPYVDVVQYEAPVTDAYGIPWDVTNWKGANITMDVNRDGTPEGVREFIVPSDFNKNGLVNAQDVFYVEKAIEKIALGEQLSLHELTMGGRIDAEDTSADGVLDKNTELDWADSEALKLVMEHAVDLNGDMMVTGEDVAMLYDQREKILEAKEIKGRVAEVDAMLEKLAGGGTLDEGDQVNLEGLIDYLGIQQLDNNVVSSFDAKIEKIQTALAQNIFTEEAPAQQKVEVLQNLVDKLNVVPKRGADYAGVPLDGTQQTWLEGELGEFFTIEELDADGNGQISGEELLKILTGIFSFDQLDTDGNGSVGDAEIESMQRMLREMLEASTLSSADIDRADLNDDGIVSGFDIDILENVVAHSFDVNLDTKIDSHDLRDWIRIRDYFEYRLEEDEEFELWHLAGLENADIDGDGIIEGGWTMEDLLSGVSPGDYTTKEVDIEVYPEMWADYTLYLENMLWVEEYENVLNFDSDENVFDKLDRDALLDMMRFIQNSTIEEDMKNRYVADIATDYDINNTQLLGRDGVVNYDDIAAFTEIREIQARADVNQSGAVTDRDVNRIREIINFDSIKAAWKEWNLERLEDTDRQINTGLTRRVISVDGRDFNISVDGLTGAFIFEPIPAGSGPSITSDPEDGTIIITSTFTTGAGEAESVDKTYTIEVDPQTYRITLLRPGERIEERSAIFAYMTKADINGDNKVNYFDRAALQDVRGDMQSSDITTVDQQFVDTVKEVYSLINAWTVTLEKEPWQSQGVYDQIVVVDGREFGVKIIDEEEGMYTIYDIDKENKAYDSNVLDMTVKVGSVVYRITPDAVTHDVQLEKLYARSEDIGNCAITVEGRLFTVSKDADTYKLSEGDDVYESMSVDGKDYVIIGNNVWEIKPFAGDQVALFKKESMLKESVPVAEDVQLIMLADRIYTVRYDGDLGRFAFSDGENTYATFRGEKTVTIGDKSYRVDYNATTDRVSLLELMPGDFNGDGVVSTEEHDKLDQLYYSLISDGGRYTTTEVFNANKGAMQYVDIGGVRYDIIVGEDGAISIKERAVHSNIIQTLAIVSGENTTNYKVTLDTITASDEGNRFNYTVLKFTVVSLNEDTNSIEEGAAYWSDRDMEMVTIGAQQYGIRWNAGWVELYEVANPDVVHSASPEFGLVQLTNYTPEKDAFATSRWLGEGKLDISGLYDPSSKLGRSEQILVKEAADQYIFIVDAELDDAAVDQLLSESGIDPLDAPAELRQSVIDEFKRSTYYYSDTRTDTVDIGGIKFDINQIPGGEVRLLAKDVKAREVFDQILLGGAITDRDDPLAASYLAENNLVTEVAYNKVEDKYVFYGTTGAALPVTQDADDTVVFGNYMRYNITEDPASGTLALHQVERATGVVSDLPVIEVDSVNYTVTDEGDGTYTFSNGTRTYTSDAIEMTVRLGEMLITSRDRYEAGMTEDELNEVRGILYDITLDANANISLSKHVDDKRPVQVIEIEGDIYTVMTGYKGAKTIMTYPAGIVVATLKSGETTLVISERTFDVAVDETSGNITLECTPEAIQSVDLQLVKVKGIRYTVEETDDPENRYQFSYMGETSSSYSTTVDDVIYHKVYLGTGEDRLRYNIYKDPASGTIRLVEDYMKGTAHTGTSMTVEGKTDPYDVTIDTYTISLTDGTNTLDIDMQELIEATVNLVVDDEGATREYYVAYDSTNGSVILSAVSSSGYTMNNFLVSSMKQIVKLGNVWYRILLGGDGRYSFSWTDQATGQLNIRYAYLSDGEVALDDDVVFTLAKDADTGVLSLSQKEYVTSRDVMLYPVTGAVARQTIEIDGVEYVLGYNVEMEWNDHVRDPENDKIIGKTLIRAYKEDYIPVPNFTLTRVADGVVYHNREILDGIVIKPSGSALDIFGREYSRERLRYTIDLPEMSIGFEEYPSMLYAPAVEVINTVTGESELFYLSERFWEEGVNSYSLYSNGEYYEASAYSSGDYTGEPYLDIWEHEGKTYGLGQVRADLLTVVKVGAQQIPLIVYLGIDPKGIVEGEASEGYDPEKDPYKYISETAISDITLFAPAGTTYSGDYTTRFISQMPINVNVSSQVSLVECQVDWQSDDLLYNSGNYPVRQELIIGGVHYYVYPEGDTLQLDAVHIESQPLPAGQPGIILGVKDYDGQIDLAGVYGYSYKFSDSGDGSIVFTDGFNQYTSDPFTNTVAIGGRQFEVTIEGDPENRYQFSYMGETSSSY
ncbi:dockerin type I domain-containing protein, partial [Candidatus Omnitrophota bacterium]